MELILKQYMHECSALICVLLDLDEPRQQLLKTLASFNVPIKVLVVTDSDTELKETPYIKDVTIIHHNSLQQDLNTLK